MNCISKEQEKYFKEPVEAIRWSASIIIGLQNAKLVYEQLKK